VRPSPFPADTTGVSAKKGVPTDEEHRLIRDLRDQLNRTRQDLIRVRAHADVSVSKATRALEREEYLIQEMRNLGAELECKYIYPESSYAWAVRGDAAAL
jgi:hypothetical protein